MKNQKNNCALRRFVVLADVAACRLFVVLAYIGFCSIRAPDSQIFSLFNFAKKFEKFGGYLEKPSAERNLICLKSGGGE